MTGRDAPHRWWPLAFGTAALCTAFLAFFTRFPAVADERLGLPIARAAADSTLYPASDLIVRSGLTGPFHFYRLAGHLYANALDVDTIWLAALVVVLFATFAATWSLAFGISRSAWIASLAVAALAAANPYRGTLHWFLFPPGNLITSTLAAPVVIGALALAAWGRWGWALVLASLSFNLHPSMGLLAAAAIAFTMIGSDGLAWSRRLGWWAAAFAAALPNVVYVVRGSAANFAGAPADSPHTFDELVGLYSHHFWIGDHWRENYGWFLMQVAGVVMLRRFLIPGSRRAVLGLTAAFCVIAIAWWANLYTVNIPAITLTFAVRGASLVKLLVFPALATCVVQWVADAAGRGRAVRLGLAGLLLVATLHKNLDIGEGMAAIAWAGIALLELRQPLAARAAVALVLATSGLVQVLGQGWGILGVAPFAAERVDQARMATIVAGAILLGIMLLMRSGESPPGESRPAHRGAALALSACAAVFGLTLALRGNVNRLRPASPREIVRAARLAEPDESVADLTSWAPRGSPGGSLFALPPNDRRFETFRLAAGRGVYAAVYDVDQLSYDLKVYGAAHARLLAQGMIVRGRHDFDGAPWDTLSAPRIAALARDGVGFAVFGAERRLASPLEFPVVYQDRSWIVYDVRSAR